MLKKNIGSKRSFSKAVLIGTAAVALATVGYFAVLSSMPVNSTHPVFGAPSNHYIKAISSKNGPIFVTTSTKGAKKSMEPTYKPTITARVGEIVSLHIINEDHEKHNLNLDEFNVHTNDIGYFGTQTITFVANKAGQFYFHCTLHPEMTGSITIE